FMNTSTPLTTQDDRLVKAMQLLGDRTRYKMFKLLLENNQLCVGEIADRLGISAPAVSQHFRIFELLDLVARRRTGQRICYDLKTNDKFVSELVSFIDKQNKE